MAKQPSRRVERATEVDAYIFIKDSLKELGWDVRNPARCDTGCVYTQNECLEHPEIQQRLGLDRPENVVKISESSYWVIEAKRHQSEIARAVAEAEEYASRINKSKNIKAVFVSGVAGNQATGYLMRTSFLVKKKFKPVTFNGKEISSLISPAIVRAILETGPAIADVPVDEALFLSKAEKINSHLHLGLNQA